MFEAMAVFSAPRKSAVNPTARPMTLGPRRHCIGPCAVFMCLGRRESPMHLSRDYLTKICPPTVLGGPAGSPSSGIRLGVGRSDWLATRHFDKRGCKFSRSTCCRDTAWSGFLGMCSSGLAEVFRWATKRPFRERRPAAQGPGASLGLVPFLPRPLERFQLIEPISGYDVLRDGWKAEEKAVVTGSRAYVPLPGDWRACR